MILEQIQKNSLAIVSLIVAFSALGYNTWRNELTEQNRNVREAGFQILINIAEVQKTTYLAHYDKDVVKGNPRRGWTQIMLLRDLSRLVANDHSLRSDALFEAWRDHWQELGKDTNAILAIDNALDDLRVDILTILKNLD